MYIYYITVFLYIHIMYIYYIIVFLYIHIMYIYYITVLLYMESLLTWTSVNGVNATPAEKAGLAL